MSFFQRIRDYLRAWPILLVALVMMVIAAASSQISLGVTLYGLGKSALGGYGGYWLDRLVFPYGRPHESAQEDDRLARSIRRALIVAACVIAAALVP